MYNFIDKIRKDIMEYIQYMRELYYRIFSLKNTIRKKLLMNFLHSFCFMGHIDLITNTEVSMQSQSKIIIVFLQQIFM